MMLLLRPYSEVRDEIVHGDMLLFRKSPGDLVDEIVSRSGRTIYKHVGRAAWLQFSLFALDTAAWRGARCTLLSRYVADYPDRTIDVYRLRSAELWLEARTKAVEAALRMVGRGYGWWQIVTVGLLHLPVVRWFAPANLDDAATGGLPHCSSMYSFCDRAGGIDPVPNLADRDTEPGDLARSAIYSYQFTLAKG